MNKLMGIYTQTVCHICWAILLFCALYADTHTNIYTNIFIYMHTYIYRRNAHSHVLKAGMYVRVCVCMASPPNY